MMAGSWHTAIGGKQKFPSGMKASRTDFRKCLTPAFASAVHGFTNSQLAKRNPTGLRDEKEIRRAESHGMEIHTASIKPSDVGTLADLIISARLGLWLSQIGFSLHRRRACQRYRDIPRERLSKHMQVIREAAGDAYILACGAPIVPSLGLCDGLRVGPDVAPYWLNEPLSIWLNNPNDTSAQNAIRTSLHRLWLRQVVNVDPDVAFFRSKHNKLDPHENQLLQDLGVITSFKATSDLPQWLNGSDSKALKVYLESAPAVQKNKRYEYQIDGRVVDFESVVPIPSPKIHIPVWLAKIIGLLKMAFDLALPAIWESKKL
jgi:alpha-galactosidase